MAGSDGKTPVAQRRDDHARSENRVEQHHDRARRRSSQRWRTGSVNGTNATFLLLRPWPAGGVRCDAGRVRAADCEEGHRLSRVRGGEYVAPCERGRRASRASVPARARESGRRARGCARGGGEIAADAREWNQVVAPSTPAREMPAGSSVISRGHRAAEAPGPVRLVDRPRRRRIRRPFQRRDALSSSSVS